MRGLLLCCLFILVPMALSAQERLPQVDSDGRLRALETRHSVRGYEAVGRLDTETGYCSATLIAPDLVLTAAHCLFERSGQRIPDRSITFLAGLRNGQAEARRGVALSFVPDAYRHAWPVPDQASVKVDVALLELDSPIHLAGVQPIRTGPVATERDVVTIVSYGRDREAFASIEEDCRVLARDAGLSALSCTVVPGSSGAPVLRETPSGLQIAAVVSSIGQLEDREAAFAVDVQDLLRELMAERDVANRRLSPGMSSLRRLNEGNGGRDEIGARFLRP